MLVYFDASALVKLVIEEDGSALAAALWDGCDAALTSRLALPEVCAALGAAHRNHELTDADATTALAAFADFWAGVRPIELTPRVATVAGEMAALHRLGGADAVHLASALELRDAGIVVAAWDRRLHEGASAAGLSVAPRIL